MARFWWVIVVAIGAGGYFVAWPNIKPKVDAYRAERLAKDLCDEAARRINGGSSVGAVHDDTRQTFIARAERNKLVFEDTVGTPFVVNERSCVLSAKLVTTVNDKVTRQELYKEFLF